jgi:hypothetical protein
MPVEEATAILTRAGLLYPQNYIDNAARCGGRQRAAGETMTIFSDMSRHGGVCLFEASDHVVAIGWEFYGLTF